MQTHHNLAGASAATWHAVRERLLPILGHLGFAPFEAYCVLWTLCGLRPSDITVTKEDLAAPLKRDGRRTLDWIEELHSVGLVDIVDREAERNTFRLYVYEPEAVSRPRKREAEPQAELFNESAEAAQTAPAEPAAPSAQLPLWGGDEKTAAETAAAEVAPKPPYMHEDIECGSDISGEHLPQQHTSHTSKSHNPGSPADTPAAPHLKTVSTDGDLAASWGNHRELFAIALQEKLADPECHVTNCRRAFDCIDRGHIDDAKVWQIVEGAIADFGTDRGRNKSGRQLSRGEMFVARMKAACPEFARMIKAKSGFGRQWRRPK